MANLFTSQTPSGDFADGSPGIVTATTLQFAVAGQITHVRFWATATVSGTYTVNVWQVTASDASGGGAGTLLATKVMGGSPTGSAWNLVALDTPVSVSTGVLYRVGVWNDSRYVTTNSFFTGGLTNGNITAPANGADPLGNGWALRQGSFAVSATTTVYPTLVGTSACYFVDVEFVAAGGAVQPLVITAPAARPFSVPVLLLRGATAAQAPATAAPGPLIITRTPTAGPAQPPLLLRSTLADPPVLTTRPPMVVTAPVLPTPGLIILTRTAAAPVAAPASTSSPLLVTAPVPPAPSWVAIRRGSLADDPVLTTPSPIVVTAPAQAPAVAAILVRSPQAPAVAPVVAPPQPIVVTTAVAVRPGQALLVRGSLVDPPVLTTLPPLVVTAPAARVAATTVLVRNPQPAQAAVSGSTTKPIVVTSPQASTRGLTVLIRCAPGPGGTVVPVSPNPELYTRSSGRDLATSSRSRELITRTYDRDLGA